jgi:hypothetical protein
MRDRQHRIGDPGRDDQVRDQQSRGIETVEGGILPARSADLSEHVLGLCAQVVQGECVEGVLGQRPPTQHALGDVGDLELPLDGVRDDDRFVKGHAQDAILHDVAGPGRQDRRVFQQGKNPIPNQTKWRNAHGGYSRAQRVGNLTRLRGSKQMLEKRDSQRIPRYQDLHARQSVGGNPDIRGRLERSA